MSFFRIVSRHVWCGSFSGNGTFFKIVLFEEIREVALAVVCPEEYLDDQPEEDGEDLLLQFDDFDEDELPIMSWKQRWFVRKNWGNFETGHL